MTTAETLTAFRNDRIIAQGAPADVWTAFVAERAKAPETTIFVFDEKGRPVDLDPRSPPAGGPPAKPSRGRPKLGVVSREVTLLPRHWDFLNAQPGGASAALRRLIDRERRANPAAFERKASQEAAYRFLSQIAGDRTNYEEALRALFADEQARFEKLIARWPKDIRAFAIRLAFSLAGDTEQHSSYKE